MTGTGIVQVKRLRSIDELRQRVFALGIADHLAVDDTVDPEGPLATCFSAPHARASNSSSLPGRIAKYHLWLWPGWEQTRA